MLIVPKFDHIHRKSGRKKTVADSSHLEANHQPTTVPVWAQNSSLQTHLHMTFTSENY